MHLALRLFKRRLLNLGQSRFLAHVLEAETSPLTHQVVEDMVEYWPVAGLQDKRRGIHYVYLSCTT